MNVSEFLAKNLDWLEACGFTEAESNDFRSLWYVMLKNQAPAIFDAKIWQNCDIPMAPIIRLHMSSSLHYLFFNAQQYEAHFIQHIKNLVDEEEAAYYVDWPDGCSPEDLHMQYATVWYKDLIHDPLYGYTIDEKDLKPVFKRPESTRDILNIVHDLLEDEWQLSFYRMPEYRWASNGKKNAWYKKVDCILIADKWLTRKHYESFQKRLKGF